VESLTGASCSCARPILYHAKFREVSTATSSINFRIISPVSARRQVSSSRRGRPAITVEVTDDVRHAKRDTAGPDDTGLVVTVDGDASRGGDRCAGGLLLYQTGVEYNCCLKRRYCNIYPLFRTNFPNVQEFVWILVKAKA
jgi:hypothetical protein